MKKTIFSPLLVVLLLFNFLTAVYAAPMEEFDSSNPRSEEGLIRLDLPMSIVKLEVEDLLKRDDVPVTKLYRFDMDPVKRVMFLDFDVKLPDSLMLSLESHTGGRELEKIHHISLTIGFPSSKFLAVTKYVQFKIHRFEFDGVDYSKGFNIINNIVPALLANRSFINYFVEDESRLPTDFRDEDLSARIKTLLDMKTFRFRDNTVSVRFDLNRFVTFGRYASLVDDLRLWHFSPVLIKGTKDKIAFRLEAGIGKPAKSWVEDAKARQEHDEQSLKQARAQFYSQFGYSSDVSNLIKEIVQKDIQDLSLENLREKYQQEIKRHTSNMQAKASSVLTAQSIRFEADPQACYEEFMSEVKEVTYSFLLDLKKRSLLAERSRNGGREGREMPFVNKRISQRVINQFVNYFRDFQFEGEQLFSKLTVQLAPQLPGIVVKGMVNLELNTLMDIGLEGEGIDFSHGEIRADEKMYGKGVPFELSLYTYFEDNGVLELDIKNASLGEGNNRVVLKTHKEGGDFLTGFTKMIVAEVLKTYLFEQVIAPESGATSTTEEHKRETLFERLENYKKAFSSHHESSDILSELVSIGELGLKDPLVTENTTNPVVAGIETIALLKDVIGYDDSTGRVRVKLDPSLFAESIYGARNNIQLWNLMPLYDQSANQVYLEAAIGNQTRTTTYLNYLDQRSERLESDRFTGITGTRDDSSPVDYSLELDFASFQQAINGILSESLEEHKKTAKAALDKVEDGSQYLLEDIGIHATGTGRLGVTMTMAQMTKKKRGFLRRFFSGSSERYSIETNRSIVTAEVGLSVENIKKYRNSIKITNDDILLSDKLIRVDLRKVGYKTGGSGIVNSLINFVIGDVNLSSGFLGRNLKKLILKVAGPMLNPEGDKNGNAVLGGVHLNDFVKIFTSKEEILLQINPRFAGAMWDFYFLENSKFNGQDVGLNINKNTGKIKIDFASALSVTTIDKRELQFIRKGALDMIAQLSNVETTPKNVGDWILLVDKLMLRSDLLRPSLLVRLKKLIENYDNIIDVSLNGQTSNQTNRFVNLTASGAELMHIVATAKTLAEALDQTADRIEASDFVGLSNYVTKLRTQGADLEERYIVPLTRFYADHYLVNNKKIIAKKVTDWNAQFYSDALFSTKVFEVIK